MILNDVEMYEGNIYMEAFYYVKEENYMIDSDGKIVYDLFRFISPSQLRLFKERAEWMIVKGVNGEPIELLYPESPGLYEFHRPERREEI